MSSVARDTDIFSVESALTHITVTVCAGMHVCVCVITQISRYRNPLQEQWSTLGKQDIQEINKHIYYFRYLNLYRASDNFC